MPNPRRGLGGRLVLLVCGSVVVLLGGTLGYVIFKERPRPGAYLDVLALDGDFVVAIRHENTRDRAFVEMIDAERGLRWQALVPSYRVADGAIGVAANDHAVTVRFPRDGTTQIFGFAPATAQKLGTVILGEELTKEPDGFMSPDVATINAGPDAYEILEPDDGPTLIYEVSLQHGLETWRRDLPTRGVEAVWATPDHLVVEQPGQVSVVARADGAIDSRAADTACVTGERVIYDGGVLCGERNGVLVVALDHPARLRFVDGTELPLGGETVRRSRRPDTLPFAGALSRHEVVQVDGKLVGLDLDAKKVTWTAAVDGTVVAARDVVLLRTGDTLASIEPATGKAIAVSAPGTLPLRSQHVAGDGVWLLGERGLLELDVKTLAPRGSYGKVAPQVTTESWSYAQPAP